MFYNLELGRFLALLFYFSNSFNRIPGFVQFVGPFSFQSCPIAVGLCHLVLGFAFSWFGFLFEVFSVLAELPLAN